jgi:hypothetical protein
VSPSTTRTTAPVTVAQDGSLALVHTDLPTGRDWRSRGKPTAVERGPPRDIANKTTNPAASTSPITCFIPSVCTPLPTVSLRVPRLKHGNGFVDPPGGHARAWATPDDTGYPSPGHTAYRHRARGLPPASPACSWLPGSARPRTPGLACPPPPHPRGHAHGRGVCVLIVADARLASAPERGTRYTHAHGRGAVGLGVPGAALVSEAPTAPRRMCSPLPRPHAHGREGVRMPATVTAEPHAHGAGSRVLIAADGRLASTRECPGAQCPGAQCPGAQCPGAQCPGAQCPGAQCAVRAGSTGSRGLRACGSARLRNCRAAEGSAPTPGGCGLSGLPVAGRRPSAGHDRRRVRRGSAAEERQWAGWVLEGRRVQVGPGQDLGEPGDAHAVGGVGLLVLGVDA